MGTAKKRTSTKRTGKNKRVVWILGAGFSVPLGGPLFRELISTRTLLPLQHLLLGGSETPESSALVNYANLIERLYHAGVRETDGRGQHWTDAEQFLEMLDIARRKPDGNLRRLIDKMLEGLQEGGKITAGEEVPVRILREGKRTTVHWEAVRYMAGACTTFLLDAESEPEEIVDKSEQWDPYTRWSHQLEQGLDSVITFNYDRSLNLLSEHAARVNARPVETRPLKGFPELISPVQDESADALSPKNVLAYHLHGHVGWLCLDDKTIDRGGCDESGYYKDTARAHLDPEHAVIGIPGAQKRGLPDKLLKELWSKAMADIERADLIVLVGYRFPETDNYAKRRLLDALRKNTKNAKVHLVLGAANPDLARVQAMINWAARPVHEHPMKAQDFFAVFERDGLFKY